MSRYFLNSRKSRHPNRKTNLIGIVTLVSILSGLLLFFANERGNSQVLNSYCGAFGFSGKYLVLMKDNTFRFSYHGCSQANGFVAGTWQVNGQIMTLSPEHRDDTLDIQYKLTSYELIPINESDEDKFTLCEYYQEPWERTAGSEKMNMRTEHFGCYQETLNLKLNFATNGGAYSILAGL